MDIFGKVFNEEEYNEKRVSRLFQASDIEKGKIPHFGFLLILLRH